MFSNVHWPFGFLLFLPFSLLLSFVWFSIFMTFVHECIRALCSSDGSILSALYATNTFSQFTIWFYYVHIKHLIIMWSNKSFLYSWVSLSSWKSYPQSLDYINIFFKIFYYILTFKSSIHLWFLSEYGVGYRSNLSSHTQSNLLRLHTKFSHIDE